jgi:hypothetical protein
MIDDDGAGKAASMTCVSRLVMRTRQWRDRSRPMFRSAAFIATGFALLATSAPPEPMLALTLVVEGPVLTLSNADPEAQFSVRIWTDASEPPGPAATKQATLGVSASLSHSDATPQEVADNTPWVTMEISDEFGSFGPQQSDAFLTDAHLGSSLTFSGACDPASVSETCEALLHVTFRRNQTVDPTLTTDVAWRLDFSSFVPAKHDGEGLLPWHVEVERLP